jgi:hypothetical protein
MFNQTRIVMKFVFMAAIMDPYSMYILPDDDRTEPKHGANVHNITTTILRQEANNKGRSD